MDRGYVAAPLCRPSLASMLTGRYPFQHGITGNDVNGPTDRAALDVPLRESFHKFPTFVKTLVAHGYLAHQSGKWWEGSWKDGGFTDGMTHGDQSGRHGDAELTMAVTECSQSRNSLIRPSLKRNHFCFGTHPFCHTPHNPPQRLLKKYQKEGRAPDLIKYYAMCEWFDETCEVTRLH